MDGLEEIVALVAIAVIGTAFARKLGMLAPIVLVIAGLGISFLPLAPEVHLEPEMVLVGKKIWPLLAAVQFSPIVLFGSL